jgi:hypothetical protein
MSDVVCRLPNGCTLYREENGVGGHRYWSDEVGGGVCIWDTCLVDISTLLAAIVEEQRARREKEVEMRRDPLKDGLP